MKKVFLFAVAVLLSVAAIHAADWPQWQGLDRTRVSRETGLLKEWPPAGPPIVWTATGLGSGYGSMTARPPARRQLVPERAGAPRKNKK